MNPYQVMAIIVSCTVVFAGVVTTLTMQGVPLLLSFLGVYFIAVWVMIGMQRRAREIYDGDDHDAQRRYDRESKARRVAINEFADAEKVSSNQLHA